MTSSITARIVAAGAMLFLFGCSDGGSSGGDPLQGCVTISGGNTRIATDYSCTMCGTYDPVKAIDGDGATYGTLHMDGVGTMKLRALAQSGIVFPAGNRVGMVHSISFGTSTVTATVTTFLDSVQQEQFTLDNGTTVGQEQSPDHPGRVSWVTAKQFNAVEFSFARPAGSGALDARIHEFCSN